MIILVGAVVTTKLCLNRDVVRLGLGASAAEVASWVGNLCIAGVVLAPMTLAINWASRLVANRFLGFSIRKPVLAFFTTMLCSRDLDPLAELHDWSDTIRATSIAFSILAPFADCRNWAGHRLWITRPKFHLVQVSALEATMLGFLRYNPVARLSTIRATLLCALVPLCPMAFAINWAWVRVAGVALDGTSLVWALLSTMKCFLRHIVDRLCLPSSTFTATWARFSPLANTIHWARCFTARLNHDGPTGCLATLTTTNLLFFHGEGLALHATPTAHCGGDISVPTWHVHLQGSDFLACAFTPFAPGALARLRAARQLTGSNVHC